MRDVRVVPRSDGTEYEFGRDTPERSTRSTVEQAAVIPLAGEST